MNKEKLTYLKTINTDNLESNFTEALIAAGVPSFDVENRRHDVAYLLGIAKENNVSDVSDISTLLSFISDEDLKTSLSFKCKPFWKKFTSVFRFKFTEDDYSAFQLILKNKPSRFEAEFSTPNSISDLGDKLLDIKSGDSVLDICSGNGEFGVNISLSAEDVSFTGIEFAESAANLSRIRLSTIGADYSIINSNAFDTIDDDIRYDKVFSNYPFALKLPDQELIAEHLLEKFGIEDDKVKTKTADWLFNFLAVSKMKPEGKAVIIMPNGTAFNSIEQKIRKYFIEKGFVETVIELPTKLFTNTAISVTMMVLSHNNSTVNFINASNIFTVGRRENVLSEANIDEIVGLIGTETEISCVKTIDDIAANNYSLLAESYFNSVEVENGVEFKTLIKSITRGAQLKANELDALNSEKPTPYQYLTIANVGNDGSIDLTTDPQYITSISDNLKKYCVKNNSLIISKIASPELKAAVADFSENTTILANGNLYIIELDEDKVNPYYLQAFFNSSYGRKVVAPKLNGIAFKMITVAGINELLIPLPDIKVQNEIAEKYKSALERICKLKSELQEATESLASIFEN